MNLKELRKSPHLSVSSINQYIECGLAYRFAKVDMAKPESNPEALVFGSTIHTCLADYYACLGQGIIMPVDELTSAFERRWLSVAQKPGQVSFKEGSSAESLLEQGKSLLAVFHQEVPKEKCRVLGIERPFAFGLEGLPVPIIGVFDLVIEDEAGVVTIVDHKTCAKAYSDREIDDSFQLTVYHMAAKADGHANRDVLLRFDCLVKTKAPSSYNITPPGPKMISWPHGVKSWRSGMASRRASSSPMMQAGAARAVDLPHAVRIGSLARWNKPRLRPRVQYIILLSWISSWSPLNGGFESNSWKGAYTGLKRCFEQQVEWIS